MKTFAKALAIASGLMFVLPFCFYLCGNINYDFTDYATFVGGTAGPMAALAGFLFIYLTFQHQQEQLDKLEQQSFESIFFRLVDHYRTERDSLDAYKKNGEPLGRNCFYYIKESLFKQQAPAKDTATGDKKDEDPPTITIFTDFYENSYRITLSEYQRAFLMVLAIIDEHERYFYLKILSSMMDEHEKVIQAFYYRSFGFDLSIDVVQEYGFLKDVNLKAFPDIRYYYLVLREPLPDPEDLSKIADRIKP